MRKLAFRAWDKKNKGFIAGFNMVNFHSYYNKGLEPHVYRYDVEWKLSDIELMQFTGLKDKNGKEIYESDLLMCEEGIRYKLEWEEQYGGYRVYFWEGKDWDWDEQIDDMYDYQTKRISLEIIGNLYENPELLK